MTDHNDSPEFLNHGIVLISLPDIQPSLEIHEKSERQRQPLGLDEVTPNFGILQDPKGSLDDPSSVIDEVNRLKEKARDGSASFGILKVKSANHWLQEASLRPIPQMLFSEFWHEGELCILFADTNLGKSILAVQIADSISKGQKIPGFKLEAERQSVLYYDFEMSDKQFENRYSEEYTNHFQFDPELFRVELDPDETLPEGKTVEEYLGECIEASILGTGARILIIDNLTYLRTETEKSKEALPLMKQLKGLKSKYGLSILVLAHTPKRNLHNAITRNDLAGSKALINFCDSSFAIGESHTDKVVRYLKQIKCRNTEMIYDAGNVMVCQLTKPSNFVGYEFIAFGLENVHLKPFSNKDRAALVERVHELSERGQSQRDIAREVGIAVGTVNKYLRHTVKPTEL